MAYVRGKLPVDLVLVLKYAFAVVTVPSEHVPTAISGYFTVLVGAGVAGRAKKRIERPSCP